MGTSGIFEFRLALLVASDLQTGFGCVLFETTIVELMVTLRIHEHANIFSLHVFRQDLSVAVLAHR